MHIAPDGSYFFLRAGQSSVVKVTNNGGSYSFTVTAQLMGLQKNTDGPGNGGFAINPANPSQAIFVSGPVGNDVFLVTGLPDNPVIAQHFTTPESTQLASVQFTPDGKYAVIGGANGIQVYGGFASGSLSRIGGVYSPPIVMQDGATYNVSGVASVGVTPDGKYVVATPTAIHPADDTLMGSLITIPIDANGNLGAIAGQYNGIVPPTLPVDDIMIVR
jgi:hypothetical protein